MVKRILWGVVGFVVFVAGCTGLLAATSTNFQEGFQRGYEGENRAAGPKSAPASAKPTTVVAAATAAPTKAAEPTVAAQPKVSRCEEPSAALIATISQRLKGSTSLSAAKAVKSNDFANAYFVTAYLNGPGIPKDGQTATWVSNRLDGSGALYSVDGFAKTFSDWIDGSTTDAAFSMRNDGARQSQECVKSPQ